MTDEKTLQANIYIDELIKSKIDDIDASKSALFPFIEEQSNLFKRLLAIQKYKEDLSYSAPHIFVIEDELSLIRKFRQWTKNSGLTLIEATSELIAIRIIEKNVLKQCVGICLDFEHNLALVNEQGENTSGQALIKSIDQHVPKSIPILFHSMNETEMVLKIHRQLRKLGYTIKRHRIDYLTAESFNEWLAIARKARSP